MEGGRGRPSWRARVSSPHSMCDRERALENEFVLHGPCIKILPSRISFRDFSYLNMSCVLILFQSNPSQSETLRSFSPGMRSRFLVT